MKRKTFIKIFLLTLCLILIIFIAGIIAMHQTSKRMTEDRLVTECHLVLNVLKAEVNDENSDVDTLLESIREHYREDAFRITVIKTDGTVIYDSEPGKDEAEYDNHLEREEIKHALAGDSKTVERYSESFDCEMTYYAEKVQLGSYGEIVLRLAVRTSQIAEYIKLSVIFLIIALLLAIGFSAWFSVVISKDVSSKISQVANGLKSLNDGKYVPIEVDSDEPELHSVYNEINELNSYVHQKMVTEEAEKRKLNEVLENVTQGIIAYDDDDEIIFANNNALSLFGLNSSCEGKKLYYLISDMRLVEKITSKPLENCNFEHSLDKKELYVTVKRILDAENNTKLASSIIIVTDITPEREMVKQKSDFFANASHELKTPITVMQGLAELSLSKENLDTSTRKSLERIHKESIRMASLIGDMLKLSRLEKSEDEETRIEVSLGTIAKEALQELEGRIQEKGIKAQVVGDATIISDPKKIYELIINLSSNAVNYNKENGEILISIKKENDKTLLSVKDTGIGIEKEHLPRIFERFYRVDKSRSKKTGGTGLGLAIVKHICAQYGATLSIDSEIGVGTEVKVEFKE